ncbi:MAG: penicillin acylase family protein [Bacteroidota bacterium]|nr:penicillin acylase family protein [Bacteroidota bacterium]
MSEYPEISIYSGSSKMRLTIVLFFILLAGTCTSQVNAKNITIARDTFGIPHIFAPTDAEAAYGLAWAHCEDDFEHIQVMMITAKTRLGEIDGKDGAVSDYFVKLIRAKELVDKQYEKDLTPSYRKILEAYAAGLNAYAASHPKEIKLKNIFPVTAKNIVTMYVVILTSMVGTPTALEAIIKGKPDEYIFNANAGSNGIAMNSGITSDSSTYLLINPHVPLEGAASWYEAHLCTEEGWNVYGALIPGMSSPAMGCNEHSGWAITFNWPDYVDIYKLEINPENKNQYKYDGVWMNFESTKLPLKVKTKLGKITVKKQALWCAYGPAYKTDKGVYALRYPTMFNVKAAEQWYNIGKSTHYGEFYRAMEMQGIPLFNFVYADDSDHIFYLFNAMLPKRDPAYDWQKVLPGNTSKTNWNTFYSLRELPQKYNPKCGYLYNTNNTPFHCTSSAENISEDRFDKQSGYSWNRVNNRDLRFTELMKGKTKISFDEFKAIKYDCTYPTQQGGIFRTFKPVLALQESKYPDIADAIAKLKKWNFSGDAANREAALVAFTFNYLFAKKEAAYNELETGIVYTEELLVEAIRHSKSTMLKNHKTIDIPYGEVQRLLREDKSFPVSGFPECLKSMASEVTKDGKLRAINGDSFIMFAKFSKEGNTYETIVPYGESRHKNNPHLTDQMEMYSKQQTKTVTLEKEKVLQTATRIYHPQ